MALTGLSGRTHARSATNDGFLQVVVWTDLPAASGAAQPWLDSGMRGLAAGNDVWADPPSWEAFVAQASAG